MKFWAAVIAGLNVLHLWFFLHLPNAGVMQFWMTIAMQIIACSGPFWMLADWFVTRGKKLEWQRLDVALLRAVGFSVVHL